MAYGNGITIKRLKELCEVAIEEGNGNKEIYISSDDEASTYHKLYYGLTTDFHDVRDVTEDLGLEDEPEMIVLLG